jgi:hypothetical protein
MDCDPRDDYDSRDDERFAPVGQRRGASDDDRDGTTGGTRDRVSRSHRRRSRSPGVLAIRGNRTAASTDTIPVMVRAGPNASAATLRAMSLAATWTCREDASARLAPQRAGKRAPGTLVTRCSAKTDDHGVTGRTGTEPGR